MSDYLSDIKLAVRRLSKAPGYSLFAALLIGGGVALFTAVYGTVRATLWPPTIFPDRDALVRLNTAEVASASVQAVVSSPDLDDARSSQTSLMSLSGSRAIRLPVQTYVLTEVVRAEAVDGDYFSTFGIAPRYGRFVNVADVDASSSVAVISHALWVRRYRADPGVVGTVLRIGGHPVEIIGVAPEHFGGLGTGLDESALWVNSSIVPALSHTSRLDVGDRERRALMLVGRLRPGVSRDVASREIAQLGQRLDQQFPRTGRTRSGTPITRGWTLVPIDAADATAARRRLTGVLVIAVALIVLVLACSHVATLVLARGGKHAHEVVLQYALGAHRWHLARQQLAESVVLVALGAIVGYPILIVTMRLLDAEFTSSWGAVHPPFRVDATVLMAAGAAMIAPLILSGLLPAVALALRTSLGNVHGTAWRRGQRWLLRAQVAISVVLLSLASVLVRQASAILNHDPGVQLSGRAIAFVTSLVPGWDAARLRRAIDRLESGDGSGKLDALAVSSGFPFGHNQAPSVILSTTDRPIGKLVRDSNGLNYPVAYQVATSPGYFKAMGTRLLVGRDFSGHNASGDRRVVILDASTAERLFGTTAVVEREVLVRVDAPPRRSPSSGPEGDSVQTMTVIGVAEDADAPDFMVRRERTIYLPLRQTEPTPPVLALVGRAGTSQAAVHGITAAVAAADSELPVLSIGPADFMLSRTHAVLKSVANGATGIAVIALILAMAGVYALQSHAVAARTSEIGIRIAIGASSSQIKRLVVGDIVPPVAQGLAMGTLLGLLGYWVFRSAVPTQVVLSDSWIVLVAPFGLLLAAATASYVPARRASRVDPIVALRHD